MGHETDAPSVLQCSVSKSLNNEYSQSRVQDPVERKKRQNRMRQRAWRERNRAAGGPMITTINTDSPWQGYGILIATDPRDPVAIRTSSLSAVSLNAGYREASAHQTSAAAAAHGSSKRVKLIPPLLPYTTDATLGRPTPTIIFPLSADHCLITLVQYNVVRALLLNMSILSLLDWLPTECCRSFGVPILDVIPPEKIPVDLQPTPLQKSTPHPYWIQAIPFPAMRDNMIRLAGKYDSDEFRYDLGEALYEGFDDVERRGCLVWEQPWRLCGWEVTEGFVRKWGFLLKGCPDVIESMNRWREVRGEDRLAVET